jgi:hypothetical protein
MTFVVDVELDGGIAGSASASCTFTYTIYSLDGKQLATGLTPERARYPNTTYFAGGETGEGSGSGGSGSGAGKSNWGLACVIDGAYVLLDVYGEIADTSVCPP